MSSLSQIKNQLGWKPPEYLKLRKGQQNLYEIISEKRKDVYAVQLPTGYGKSWCACIAYATLRSQSRVDRVLFVVPSDAQRSQYISGLKEDLYELNIQHRDIEKCGSGEDWVIRRSFSNESEIFIATVQSISSCPDWFGNLMSKGHWLVVADEFHHYGEDNTWGTAVKSLNSSVVLGMSATPIRGDGSKTIFGYSEFDVSVSLSNAIQEGAVRGVECSKSEYEVTWNTSDDPNPQTMLMSQLSERADGDISNWEFKKGVRYYSKYISSLITLAIDAYLEFEARHPGENQILVFAMTCKHAESVAEAINAIAPAHLAEKFADWVGTGSGNKESRSKKQNDEIIQKFQDNELPCLVQVNLAGEGFNNKRCSIGVMLDLIGDTPMKRQHIGRFMRVNPKAKGQLAVVFTSTDSPSLQLLEAIQEFTDQALEPMGDERPMGIRDREGAGDTESDEYFPRIPDLEILDTEFKHEERIYPYGDARKTALYMQAKEPGFASAPIEKLEEAVKNFFTKEASKPKELSSEEKRKRAADQVKNAVTQLANTYLRKKYKKTFDSDLWRRFTRNIHAEYKRVSGSKQSQLTIDGLDMKNKWVQEVQRQIIEENKLPEWMDQ